MKTFQEFICDSRLSYLIETLKKTDDIFKIISPTENQHSQILQWLFDSRDGHGQGDAIFKDFLTAAYFASKDNVESNKVFFEEWRPSKIACTGFHSMFSIKEYILPSKKRLDLLMIDMTNKMIVVIENKHGSQLGQTQTSDYYREVARIIRRRRVFSGFLTAHIVLDRNYDLDKYSAPPPDAQWNRWAFLNYSWLESGAKRAEFQLNRGNQSAELVIAYCQRQSDYIPSDETKIGETFAELANDYKSVIDELCVIGETDVAELTPAIMAGEKGDFWHFAKHHPEILQRLRSIEALAYLFPMFPRKYHAKKFSKNFGKNWFTLFDESWNFIMDDDEESWPIYLDIWRVNGGQGNEKKFNVAIRYTPSLVREEVDNALNEILKIKFPELAKGRTDAGYRLLGRKNGVSHEKIGQTAMDLYELLDSAITTTRSKLH